MVEDGGGWWRSTRSNLHSPPPTSRTSPTSGLLELLPIHDHRALVRPRASTGRPLAGVERWYEPVDHGEAVVIACLADPRGVTDHTVPDIEDEGDGRARER